MHKTQTYCYPLATGIKRTKKFEEKGLATHAVNIGTKCGHGCRYCSTGSMLRCHPSFKAVGRSPFDNGYAIVDTDMPAKVAADAKRIQKRGMVQLCTTVDAWAPEAQELDMGRKCLEAILSQPGWTVRILTKNAAVTSDFDLIQKYRDRVLVGLSLTGTPETADAVQAVEPNASPIGERMDAMRHASEMGLRTYAMLCPLLPGIADSPSQIDCLVRFAKEVGAEEVYAEALNPRGSGLTDVEDALREGGFEKEALAVGGIHKRKDWSPYAADLIANIQEAMKRHGMIERLRFLLYPKNLTAKDTARIRKDSAGVIWL